MSIGSGSERATQSPPKQPDYDGKGQFPEGHPWDPRERLSAYSDIVGVFVTIDAFKQALAQFALAKVGLLKKGALYTRLTHV